MTTMTAPDPALDGQFYDGVPARRFVAFCIDAAIVLAIWVVVLVLGLFFTLVTLGAAAPLMVLAAASADFLYRWFTLSEGSATLGMRLTGIEIRTAAGSRLDPAAAFLHVAGFYLSVFFTPLLVLGWILMAASPRRRLLHDAVLGAVAINRPA